MPDPPRRHAIVVEVARRGRQLVGEPYFTPGLPIVLDPKGLGDLEPGDLAVVRTGPRARAGRAWPRAARRGSRTCSRRCSSSRARASSSSRIELPEPTLEGRVDLRELAHAHDRPRHGEGLRRRALVPARAGRDPRLGAHRRRLVLRPGRLAARPRRGRARVLDLRPGPRRADAAATSSPTTPARCGPNHDRLCVTVEMPPRGEPLFYRSVIRSDARLTYGQAERREAPPEILEQLALADELATRAAARRGSRAARSRSRRPRSRSRFEDGRVADAWLEGEPHAHMLVEELMILANEHVAAFLASRGRRALYRVHEQPDPQAVAAPAREARRPRACRRRRCPSTLSPQAGRRARRGDLAARSPSYVAQSGRGEEAFPALVLRALKQARYDPRNLGHSGPREPGVLPLHLADPPLPRPRRPPRAAARARPGRRRRCPTTSTRSPSTPRRASARRRRSSTSPTTSASRGCSRTPCTSAAGRSRGRARSRG